MRIGTIAYACASGLGYLAKSFYDHGVITDILVVRHAHHQTFDDWYPGSPQTPIRPFNTRLAMDFCASKDVMFFLETPFDYTLITHCRNLGVKSVLCPMYECSPRQWPALPDLFICPSLLDLDMAKQHWPQVKSIFIPVPVDVPWRQRYMAKIYVHNAGHGGLKGRNGTSELLDAMKYVKSPIKLILRSQEKLQWDVTDPRIDLRIGTVPYDSLWNGADCLIFPERNNGLSLPLQEARASGLLVMASDRFPMNTWLPREPLIPVASYQRTCTSPRCLEFEQAIIDPRAIAARIDEWYGKDITEYSISGKQWAEEMSWLKLKPKYLEALAI